MESRRNAPTLLLIATTLRDADTNHRNDPASFDIRPSDHSINITIDKSGSVPFFQDRQSKLMVPKCLLYYRYFILKGTLIAPARRPIELTILCYPIPATTTCDAWWGNSNWYHNKRCTGVMGSVTGIRSIIMNNGHWTHGGRRPPSKSFPLSCIPREQPRLETILERRKVGLRRRIKGPVAQR
ncbi:hypothetical protein F5B17DRAFT_142800 [Nemania serpens]|nr:hypothetical protein F5B17DRAFT_142800 [Nemania serpens]